MRRHPTALVAAALALAVGGCDAEPRRAGADAAPLLTWAEAGAFPRTESPALASREHVAVLVGDALELRRRADDGVVLTHHSPAGFHVNDVFLDGTHLVVVDSHDQEEQPDRPTVIDVRSGKRRTLGPEAPAPVTGTWAVGGGRMFYTTAGTGGGFCLAETDLTALTGDTVDCVERRHGITQVSPSPYGVAFTTFDDQRRPMSCLTPRLLRDDEVAEVAGVRPCRAWEALAAGDDTVLWSVITRPQQIERGEFYARVGDDEPRRLGTGLTGSLTWCGDAAWFTRYGDDDEPGALLRWSSTGGLDEALRLDSTAGVLSTPLCGGDTVSVAESRGGTTILHTAPVRG